MLGTITFINLQTHNYCMSIKNGKCVICNTSDIKELAIGHQIEFDKDYECTYFFNSNLNERISGSVIYIDISCSQCESYCR